MTARSKIRLLMPDLPPASALLPYLKEIDADHRYTNFGPLCQRLEAGLTELVGAPYTVCVSSCTVGLELTLQALNLPPGSKIALPSLTFPATGTAIMRSGFEPVFCDIDQQNCLLTPAHALAAADAMDIAAVLPVCVFGKAHEPQEWDALSRDTGIPVLIDAAGAIDQQLPGVTTAAVYSLHATKPLSSGEGGFLATSDASLAARVRSLSNFGFGANGIGEAGTNGKLSEYHAAVGLAALDAWPDHKVRRQQLFSWYQDEFENSHAASHAAIVSETGIGATLAIGFPSEITREDLDQLAQAGIEIRRWYYPPLHRHKAFSGCAKVGELKATNALAERLLGLPYHLFMTSDDVAYVCNRLARLFQ